MSPVHRHLVVADDEVRSRRRAHRPAELAQDRVADLLGAQNTPARNTQLQEAVDDAVFAGEQTPTDIDLCELELGLVGRAITAGIAVAQVVAEAEKRAGALLGREAAVVGSMPSKLRVCRRSGSWPGNNGVSASASTLRLARCGRCARAATSGETPSALAKWSGMIS